MSLLFNFKAYFTGSNYKLKTCLLLNVVYFLQIFVSTGREQEKKHTFCSKYTQMKNLKLTTIIID